MSSREIHDRKYYEILGVSPTSNQDDIKMAYVDSSIKKHPDKGGGTEKIKELDEAYEVLSDPEQRAIYDKYRELIDILDPVFGGTTSAVSYDYSLHGGTSRSLRARFGEDFKDILMVSLEDLYNGTIKKLSLSRYISCQQCKGKGTKTGRPSGFYAFQGSGFKKIQVDGHEYNGSGEVIGERDKCPSCKGSEISEENELLEVDIYEGMNNGQKIVFELQRDKAPGTISGNIVLILKQIEHPKFKRRDNNLFVEHSLSLIESLCGFQFSLTHLDGRKLIIKSNPGEVIKPGQSKAIYNEGMPQLIRPFTRGSLYIRFIVKFPDSGFLSPEQCIAFKKVLPLKSSELSEEQLEDCVETILEDFDIKDEIESRGCAQQ